MWFRQGQSVDADGFRVSLKNRMRRFRSPDKHTANADDQTDNAKVNHSPVRVPSDGQKCEKIVIRSPSGKKLYKSEKEKAALLLTDRKFKNNRVLKSSSKGKITDIDNALKNRNNSNRKISAPPVLDSGGSKSTVPIATAVKKHVRSHSNLNLNALLRYKLSNKKLSTADFDRIRRKSLTGDNGVQLTSPIVTTAIESPAPNVNCLDELSEDGSTNTVFTDEDVFLSATEEPEVVLQQKSPSLGARVAARFAESANAKAKKAKQKKRKNSRGNALYSQNSFDRPTSASVVRQPSDRRPEPSCSTSSHGQNSSDLSHTQSTDADPNAQDTEADQRDSSKSKSAPVSVNRSESYKERLSHRRNRNNRRKTSDPSLSKTNDEQVELGISNANFTNSSSSSLSSSIDSPSTSLEAVGAPTAGQGTVPAPRQWVDSEDEAGDLEADWSSNVAADTLQNLSKHEKERQEIINEIYQTERNHVRTLKLLVGIFQRPLQESGALNSEHLTLLFPPALHNLKEHHSLFEQQLKQRRIDHGSVVTAIGDLLLSMFDGRTGEDLKDHAAHFCARQQIALEALKEKRRKDESLQRLLTKAESHKACRRLQLKDLLPTALQRLTKYPLLFESLYTITLKVDPENEAESSAIKKSLDLSKRILDHVNQAVRIAEDAHKLQTIQKKLDKSSYDKEAANEFKNIDLTQHKLLHDGLLISKKNPGLQIHALLFENIMVLLQKLDDKYILKSHTCPYTGSGDGGKGVEGKFNPVSKINLILVRNLAVDKNTFFLINTSSSQMMELTAPSSSECKTWVKHISDAADAFKSRTKGHHEHVEDAAAASAAAISNPSTKESLEETPEKELIAGVASVGNSSKNNSVDMFKDADDPLMESNNNRNSVSKRRCSGHTPAVNDESGDDEDTTSDRAEVKHRDDNHDIGDDVPDVQQLGKREYSNNSNNTRTLTQQSSLVPPSEVQISVSPAMTAEPVLTPNEQLRRLDESIRLTLAEKQRVVCDMFRVPNEHFMAIADIVGQPEAPKDPSDIVLAAFAQVQSLTETLNEYIRVSQHQEISAVSTSLCDECHKNNQNLPHASRTSCPGTNSSDATFPTSLTAASSPTTATFATVVKNNACSSPLLTQNITEPMIDDVLVDDDGYCEIDELRLPAVLIGAALTDHSSISQSPASTSTPELKRQSTISADSIPEETEHEIHAELISNTAIDGDVVKTVIASSDCERADSHNEINDTYETTSQEISECIADIENASLFFDTQPQPVAHCVDTVTGCGANRLAHATSLAPAVPCHLISNYVTALSLQISLLLPKLNERDIEREKLRKENQHLRELLNSMHERERVSNERDTPRHASETRSTSSSSHQFDSTD